MSTIDSSSVPSPPPAPKKRKSSRLGDALFAGSATGAGLIILTLLAGVAVFLLIQAIPAFQAPAEDIPGGEGLFNYIAPLAFGTVLAATIAVILAVPLALSVSLFISHIAPPKLAQPLSFAIDLLAAIPSLVYGLWGIAVLGPYLTGVTDWLARNASFLPFFEGPATTTGRTMFTVGIVLAVMITPIITAITREVFSQTPRRLQEAALALGATRWEMIRMTVLPFGRSAIISASMIGLGRALGETLAVTIILSVSGGYTFNLVSSGNASTIAANIALDFPESSGLDVNVLIASGLVLFVITLVVNMAARVVINKTEKEHA